MRAAGQVLRAGLPLLVGAAACVAATMGMRVFVVESRYFLVEEVALPKEFRLPGASTLLGRNLWRVDLAGLQRAASALNPGFRDVRVVRRWPRRLTIQAVRRVPVAQVRAHQYYSVDVEGVVTNEGQTAPTAALPILDGVETAAALLVPGQAFPSPRLQAALDGVRHLTAAPELRGHRVQRVDASSATQLLVYLDDGLEVRLGPTAGWPERLPRLRKALDMLAQQRVSVAYVDLRFDEDPIIGPPR